MHQAEALAKLLETNETDSQPADHLPPHGATAGFTPATPS
jgi:hypothetical protein